MNIREVLLKDAEAITQIYNHYITHSFVTFEESGVPSSEMIDRIKNIQDENLPWSVAINSKSDVIGYAYASKWKGRCAYRFSVEVTVYVHPDSGGCGIGTQLYKHLFAALKDKGLHVVIGGITLPNAASIALHEKFGLKKSGHFKEVGFKFNQWVDVGYWQGFL